MDLRRFKGRIAMLASCAAMSVIGAFAVVALVGSGRDGGNSGRYASSSGGVRAFSACITQTRFLVLARHGYADGRIETIKDRVRGAVVGEVAVGRRPPTLGGAAAGNGRYVMSTATPLGRDATAIEGCWDRFFPLVPNA